MKRHNWLPGFLAALVLAVLAATVARAQTKPKPLKTLTEWRGSVADLTLQGAAPAGGVITSKKALEDLWKAWKPSDKVPEIDFTKEVVLIAVSRGSRLNLSATLDDKGNLQPLALATRDLRPGFRFHIIKVNREGIQTVNGKPLPKD